MKIFHTSDWHLGRSLYGRKRYEEFSAFLDWLTQTIEDEQVDALMLAGADVCSIAEQKRTAFKSAGHDGIPIIAMGHLFTAGGKTVDGDGVRELYVGSLAHGLRLNTPAATSSATCARCLMRQWPVLPWKSGGSKTGVSWTG